MKQIIADSDVPFYKWAIEAILTWANRTVSPNVTHIHGTKDMTLPYKFVRCDHTITGGKHLMVMSRAKEISVLLKQLILDRAKEKAEQ